MDNENSGSSGPPPKGGGAVAYSTLLLSAGRNAFAATKHEHTTTATCCLCFSWEQWLVEHGEALLELAEEGLRARWEKISDEEPDTPYQLGDLAHDSISGFQGTVIGRAEYLYCTLQLLIAPAAIERGAPAEPHWFQVGRVRPGRADGSAGFVKP